MAREQVRVRHSRSASFGEVNSTAPSQTIGFGRRRCVVLALTSFGQEKSRKFDTFRLKIRPRPGAASVSCRVSKRVEGSVASYLLRSELLRVPGLFQATRGRPRLWAFGRGVEV